MGGHLELALHLGLGETERLELPCALGIAALGDLPGPLLFLFAFFQSLGEAGFRIDESFSSVTQRF